MRKVCIILITCLLLTEFILNTLDPLGVATYYQDIYAINRHKVALLDAQHYLRIGKTRFRHWEANVTSIYTRYVYPQNIHADCRIAFVGDSMTFGQGVDDYKTFASHFAYNNRDVQWMNAGMMGYNTRNVYDRVESVDADGYVWLMIQNDLGGENVYYDFVPRRIDMGPVSIYNDYRIGTFDTIRGLSQLRKQRVYSDHDIAEHMRYAALMAARDDVLIFAFEEVPTEYLPVGAIYIERPMQTVSWFDQHPNALGHRAIYEQMQPAIGAFVQAIC